MEEAFTWQQKTPGFSGLEKPKAALHAECSVVRSLHQLVHAHTHTPPHPHTHTRSRSAQHKPAAHAAVPPLSSHRLLPGLGKGVLW